MVVGLTKWGSAGLSYSDPSQHSNKILCKLGSIAWEEVYKFRATTDTGDICKKKASPGSKVSCHGRLETVTSIHTSIFFFEMGQWRYVSYFCSYYCMCYVQLKKALLGSPNMSFLRR